MSIIGRPDTECMIHSSVGFESEFLAGEFVEPKMMIAQGGINMQFTSRVFVTQHELLDTRRVSQFVRHPASLTVFAADKGLQHKNNSITESSICPRIDGLTFCCFWNEGPAQRIADMLQRTNSKSQGRYFAPIHLFSRP